MMPLSFSRKSSGWKILCIGAHSDDIEIGCGGAILELLRTSRNIEIHWAVLSSGADREQEAHRSAALFLRGTRNKQVEILDFRNGYFPYQGAEIKDFFEQLKTRLSPDLIFTHARHDLHQDHRLVNQLTWNTWRNHLILEYEIPKYDADLGSPNFFIPFSRRICDLKIKYLMDCFKTQRDKHWFTRDTFQGLMRIRGVEANAPGKFAEAFYSRKLILGA